MMNQIQLPENAILSGASALSWLNIISYTPSKITITLPRGSENKNYYLKKGYFVSGASKELYSYKIEKINGFKIYSKERLFVDLCKTPLENTIRAEAIKNLEKKLIPAEVKRIYEKVKNIYRNVNLDFVKTYLDKYFMPINQMIIEKPLLAGDLIREYALILLNEFNLPILLKGGAAIELFLNIKRATEDIDLLAGKNEVKKILEKLLNWQNDLYFKIDQNLIKDKLTKRIIKLELEIRSNNIEVKKIINNKTLKITFNQSISTQEINNLIKSYQLSKRALKYFPKQSCYSFSIEMLMAEKYQSLITKPENTTRTKDLIDLYMLKKSKKNYDIKKIYQWYLRKNEIQRNFHNQQESLKIIKDQKNKKLVKIEKNWHNSISMYHLEIKFAKAYAFYQEISNDLLLLANNNK